MMVMTVLEANVDPALRQTLEAAYASAIEVLDPGIVQTFLVHNRSDDNTWQIITIWESWEALTRMRQSGATPRGVLIFRQANVEPMLTIYEVVTHAKKL